ncbi:MAG: site-2 protease family protein [Candidatus Aminicenantales bacterium]
MSLLQGIVSLFVVLFAITVHEASHGWAALKMGDPTAYHMGRITLNPLHHIDPIGTILLPLILIIMGAPPFGWAKPVPVNPFNLRNPRRDNLLISAAGPGANMLVAFAAYIGIQIIKGLASVPGGGVTGAVSALYLILYYTVVINVILAVFNLIPIPPLDGSGVLMGLISEEAAQKYESLRPYGFLILLLLIMTGFVGRILMAVLRIVDRFI